MNYFHILSPEVRDALFLQPPASYSKTSPQNILRRAVGGLLYTPGTRANGADIVLNGTLPLLTSLVFCLEDAVGDSVRNAAMANTVVQLERIQSALESGQLSPERLPLLFIRVRDAAMLEELSADLVRLSSVLTGVVLPKVTSGTLSPLLEQVEAIASQAAEPFYAMPILESAELLDAANRPAVLHHIREIIQAHFHRVLNIRVGATDLCGLLGVRRSRDTSIYQILPIAQILADVVGCFGPGDRYTLSAPVWEYYGPANSPERAGLEQELSLDIQNCFLGKTCVHPLQLPVIQAAFAVPQDLWEDANTILDEEGADWAVLAGSRRNKMNERRPHALWAERVLSQAHIYGVLRDGVTPADLTDALEREVCRV